MSLGGKAFLTRQNRSWPRRPRGRENLPMPGQRGLVKGPGPLGSDVDQPQRILRPPQIRSDKWKTSGQKGRDVKRWGMHRLAVPVLQSVQVTALFPGNPTSPRF